MWVGLEGSGKPARDLGTWQAQSPGPGPRRARGVGRDAGSTDSPLPLPGLRRCDHGGAERPNPTPALFQRGHRARSGSVGLRAAVRRRSPAPSEPVADARDDGLARSSSLGRGDPGKTALCRRPGTAPDGRPHSGSAGDLVPGRARAAGVPVLADRDPGVSRRRARRLRGLMP